MVTYCTCYMMLYNVRHVSAWFFAVSKNSTNFSLTGEGGGDGSNCFCSSSSRLRSGMHSEANTFKSTLIYTIINTLSHRLLWLLYLINYVAS